MNIEQARKELQDALYAGFVDGSTAAKAEYLPRLIINDPKTNTKVLSSLLAELNTCDEFFFSVAFITNSGVAVLINTLKELEEKGIKGKIIASQYQDFTEPRALRRLIGLKNIELRIQTENNFHAKGYIFRHQNQYSVMIGSSNLTSSALCVNSEWNLRVHTENKGKISENMLEEFERQFEMAVPVTDEWINQYEAIYEAKRHFNSSIQAQAPITYLNRPKPNKMQVEALKALEVLRNEGKNKALLISATGTGKTYLSAFDAKKAKPRKLLFVVHRENIARAAMRTFQNVFGTEITTGLFTGHKHDLNADFVFSTVQTMSKEANFQQFTPDYFDYIVIDEVHRAGADTYQRLISYFKPKFMLGMSATPERTDGFDIFKTFDYNIAYEIRLHDALEQKMLVPFHYYGVTDITVDGEVLDDNAGFNRLTCDERIAHITHYADYYGCDRGRVKGLIFCSNVEEGKELSFKLNQAGRKTIFLGGENSEDEREKAINLLETDDSNQYLDYIITRDIFNEGVDIPSVNQIIMLRPTQSAIVFVQQLGRGLRKRQDKEFLTVIDFIGNYSNNFLVPIALYGDKSFNKDTIRKLVTSGSSFIPGASSVEFDKISKERIYESINKANTSQLKDLKNDYKLLKYKLGHSPSMMDFVNHGSRDPYAFVLNSQSYYAFLCKASPEDFKLLPDKFMKRLAFFSMEVCNGKRVDELLILRELMDFEAVPISTIEESLSAMRVPYKWENIESAVRVLNGEFTISQTAVKYAIEPVCRIQGASISRSEEFSNLLRNSIFYEQLADLIAYATHQYEHSFDPVKNRGGFVLYEKYSRKDVCRILRWDKDEASTMYGYRIKYNTCPIFVTYKKSNDISESTKYEDYFLDQERFHWMTRNNVSLDSQEPVTIKNYAENGLRICLFVKQSDGESDDFYFIGDVTPYEFNQVTIKNGKGKELPIVNVNFTINDRVEDNLYNYLISSTNKNEEVDTNKVIDNIEYLSIPIYGEIAAGHERISYGEVLGKIETPKKDISSSVSDYFYFKVIGDSMINAGINDGSLVLIQKKRKRPQNGEIIACDTGDGLTLKRFFDLGKTIELRPENPAYKSFFIEKTRFENNTAFIIGAVVKILNNEDK